MKAMELFKAFSFLTPYARRSPPLYDVKRILNTNDNNQADVLVQTLWGARAMFIGVVVLCCGLSCVSVRQANLVQVKEGLGLFEALIPVSPDRVVELYEDFEPARFYRTYEDYLFAAQQLIDTLNFPLPAEERIDTLAIDHAIENFGNAARSGKTIFISSSYFFLFNDSRIIRSVITHEFGHIYYDRLSSEGKTEVAKIWQSLQNHALFYIFRDGEYSGNAKFGGHPEETPTELFASAFNLFRNRYDEMQVRLQYVDSEHFAIVEHLRNLVEGVTRPL
jgi:hypothetical protein